jgi:hypothetical protein
VRCRRMLVNVADTPENRKEFGCTGTAEQASNAPDPHRHLKSVVLGAGPL